MSDVGSIVGRAHAPWAPPTTLPEPGRPPGWTREALCAYDPDPDLWFTSDPELMAVAKAICSYCPVRDACEQMGVDEDYGVWGGEEHRPPVENPCEAGLHEKTRESVVPMLVGDEVRFGCRDCMEGVA